MWVYSKKEFSKFSEVFNKRKYQVLCYRNWFESGWREECQIKGHIKQEDAVGDLSC